MTSEFLLDAIGTIDDDLVLEARQMPKRRSVPWGSIAGLAAAVVLCVGIARIPGAFPWNGALSGSAVQEADNAANTSDALLDQYRGDQETSTAAPSAAGKENNGVMEPKFFTQRGVYLVTVPPTVQSLPEDCIELGTLVSAVPGTKAYPATGTQEFVGCPVWESADGTMLYIQMTDGKWLSARLYTP